MPETILTINSLQEYMAGVTRRADHHAPAVREVVLALAGAVILFKDADTDLKVWAKEGSKGNVLWATIGNQRYAFVYNHEDRTIEVRTGSIQGAPIISFTNAATTADVLAFFESLQATIAQE